MRLILILLLWVACALSVQAHDTITIRVDTACNNFMPGRMHYAGGDKLGDTSWSYTDSIRVCGTIVHKTNQDYYLIVYDMNGFKRLEGNFFDQYANGHCIHYDPKGRKTAEGEYEMTVKRRYATYKKKGDWKYYNTAGVLIRTEKE